MYYIDNFIIYSILGYIFETLTALIFHINSESGFMYGPYTIVYGIGITLMYIIYKKYNLTRPKLKKWFLMFITGFIILMPLEWIGGICLKNIYHVEMWNYKKLLLNIGKYISIEITTAWVLASMLLYFFIKPLTDKLIKKIPNVISLSILVIMIIDFIVTTLQAIF